LTVNFERKLQQEERGIIDDRNKDYNMALDTMMEQNRVKAIYQEVRPKTEAHRHMTMTLSLATSCTSCETLVCRMTLYDSASVWWYLALRGHPLTAEACCVTRPSEEEQEQLAKRRTRTEARVVLEEQMEEKIEQQILAKVGPDRYGLPHYRMPCDSTNEGSKCVG
jgi:hypothetical protein